MRRMNSSPLPVCRCEKETRVITSWTSKNPRRRFAVCVEGCCGYWAWIDEEMCRRATEIIPGLLRKINATEKDRDEYEEIARRNERKVTKLKEKVKELEKEIRCKKWVNKLLVKLLFLTWILIFLILMSWGQKNGNLVSFRQIQGACKHLALTKLKFAGEEDDPNCSF